MRKFFKGISIGAFALSAVLFLLMGYADISIPDEIYLTESKEISSGAIFTYSLSREIPQERKVSDTEKYEMNIRLFDTIPVKTSKVTLSKRQYVTVSGKIFGIRMYTDGVMVVANQDIETDEGVLCPGDTAGIKPGDIIKKADGENITSSARLSKVIKNCSGKAFSIKLIRNSKETEVMLKPVKCKTDGKYKAGLWVRDSTAGIGTMTFFNRETGIFAGLGHAVCDVDTGKEMPISNGDAVKARVNGCYKGKSGTPGELCGVLEPVTVGDLYVNGETGVYGVLKSFDDTSPLMPVALPQETKTGKAKILSTVDSGEPQYYDAEITSVFRNSSGVRNMVIKITDENLISKTGGIVQGMSGTPIIQNGMFIGAITHVFVNDPTRGYAIFAENMLETAQSVANSEKSNKAS